MELSSYFVTLQSLPTVKDSIGQYNRSFTDIAQSSKPSSFMTNCKTLLQLTIKRKTGDDDFHVSL